MHCAVPVVDRGLGVAGNEGDDSSVIETGRLVDVRDLDRGRSRGIDGRHLSVTEIDRPAGHGPFLDRHAQVEVEILGEGAAEHGRNAARRAGSRDNRRHRDLKIEIEPRSRICLRWLSNRRLRRTCAKNGCRPEIRWG